MAIAWFVCRRLIVRADIEIDTEAGTEAHTGTEIAAKNVADVVIENVAESTSENALLSATAYDLALCMPDVAICASLNLSNESKLVERGKFVLPLNIPMQSRRN